LLKQLGELGGSADQLVYWDELIAETGALIVSLRTRTVEEMNTVIQTRHTQLTNGLELSELRYLPSLDEDYVARILDGQPGLMDAPATLRNMDAGAIKVMYLEKLKALRNEEIRRGVTTIGPHRDDLLFSANGIDLGVYGSRGQIRTAVMALKLAEVHWLEEKTGEVPVLLLDETLAELDEQRRGHLMAELAANSQSIMTTTDLDLFDAEFVEQCVVWHLQDGTIREG
jgi:DNA replication and repair protein RecF